MASLVATAGDTGVAHRPSSRLRSMSAVVGNLPGNLAKAAKHLKVSHALLNSSAATSSDSAPPPTAVLSAAKVLDFPLMGINWNNWRDRVPLEKLSQWDIERIGRHESLPCLAELDGVRKSHPSR